ncbi:hypothetical protein [Streptomyces sp. NPDC088719]|uniref:hypothetical protein n=1 Tax=Streptomyces sp. NPDC088719 TaxID=3365872 RepID=UPI00381232E4
MACSALTADPHHPHHTDALGGLAAPARARHFGVASRDVLLPHRSSPQRRVLDDYDDYGAEVTGYLTGWSVAAARAATGLVLATTESTRAHPRRPDTAWIRGLWKDRAQAPEDRLADATGWLCLTNEPVPHALHTTVDALATEERTRAMDTLPWMTAVGCGESELLRCVRRMLHPEKPEPCDGHWAPLP